MTAIQNQNTGAVAPFSATYSPQLPELLLGLNCSIALTTYQAGKLVLISPNPDKERLTTLPRSFNKPMGIAINGDSLVLATKDEVITFENSKDLAVHYPNKQNTYDNLWVPRITFHTGQVDLHDIAFGADGIYAVNTSFSCICKIDGNYNFKPVWNPPFITQMASADFCHLNGMVMVDGKPKYVTALGTTNTPQGWRDDIVSGGVLMDVETNETVLEGLAMPHSPKMHNGELYFLQSASGSFCKMNLETKEVETLREFEGFCRGLAIHQDYAFIGFSKLRKNSSTFAKLKFSDKADFAGIKIIHLPTNAQVAEVTYQTSVDEIYEITIFPNTIRPNILNTINPVHKQSLSIPQATFWAKPESGAN